MHVQASLQTALERARASARQLHILIDTAPIEGAYLRLERWGVPHQSLFDGSREESLREIAPLLVHPHQLDASSLQRLFSWIEHSAYAAPCVCWFETSLSATHIAQHLRRFHLVGLTDGQSMIMRWYDTRILPVWITCLSPTQLNAFAADTSAWQYVDRFGDVKSLEVGADALDGSLPEPALDRPWIELGAEQYGLLVDAADLTIMLARVRAVIPDETKRVPARDLARFVAHHQSIAAGAGLRDIDRQAQYVLLALYTSGRAGEQAELEKYLSSAPEAFEAFYEGLQALSDAVWEAGPPLWASIGPTRPRDDQQVGMRETPDAR